MNTNNGKNIEFSIVMGNNSTNLYIRSHCLIMYLNLYESCDTHIQCHINFYKIMFFYNSLLHVLLPY